MDDLQNRLQSILSDPEQMRQIAAMAESLGLKPPEQNPPSGHSERSEESASSVPAASPNRHSERSEESVPPIPPGLPDLSALMGSLSAMQGTEDRVFASLRPSLSPTGQGKADRASRAAKLARLAGRFLTRQRDGHVYPLHPQRQRRL